MQYWKNTFLLYMHINLKCKSLQICAHKINTFLSHIVLTMAVFIWSKYSKTAILWNIITISKLLLSVLIYFKMLLFIPVMAKLIFQEPLL